MNEHDSEIMAGMLEEIGYERADERRDAEVLIINTCSVRENADKRFFGTSAASHCGVALVDDEYGVERQKDSQRDNADIDDYRKIKHSPHPFLFIIIQYK